jgi:hypothetical protein
MKALSLAIQKIWPMLKFLQTGRKTDKQTDRPKTVCPRSFDAGHKKIHNIKLKNCTHFQDIKI